MDVLDLDIKKDESYESTSEKINLLSEKVYSVQTIITGHKGVPYCSYFGVILFDKTNNEIIRRITWLNDFSGQKKSHKIVFKTTKNTDYAYFVYRINNEVPIKSDCKITIQSFEKITYNVDNTLEEDYNIPEDYQLPLNRILSQDEEIKLEKNLVWIFGAPRSGTSWLGTQLLSYETHSINEPLIGMHLGFVLYRNVNRARTKDLFQNEADYFFSNRFKQTWKYHLRKLILNRIFAQFNDYDHPIIIKEPNGSLASDIISETLPKSKFIFLKRDGRDVIDSRVDSMKKEGWAVKAYNLKTWPEDSKEKVESLKELCLMWVNTINVVLKAFENHSTENKLEIKYEHIKEDTYNVLQKIYNFIEIKIPDTELMKIVDNYSFKKIPDDKKGSGKITRSASTGKWKENFSEEEKLVMQKAMGDTLEKLGYVE